eukprot:COSAG01_NODE_2977_length_6764_cov_17.259865_3_plen_81_part_00
MLALLTDYSAGLAVTIFKAELDDVSTSDAEVKLSELRAKLQVANDEDAKRKDKVVTSARLKAQVQACEEVLKARANDDML